MDALKTMPLIINIKNLTDEKLYDVNVFNDDYKKQDKIKYSTRSGYDNLLKYKNSILKLDNELYKIQNIEQLVLCDYIKFLKKQTFCDIEIQQITPEYSDISVRTFFNIIPPRTVGMSSIRNIKARYNKGLNIKYDFLMPETEIKLLIFMSKE